jgi:hypothetical protein
MLLIKIAKYNIQTFSFKVKTWLNYRLVRVIYSICFCD